MQSSTELYRKVAAVASKTFTSVFVQNVCRRPPGNIMLMPLSLFACLKKMLREVTASDSHFLHVLFFDLFSFVLAQWLEYIHTERQLFLLFKDVLKPLLCHNHRRRETTFGITFNKALMFCSCNLTFFCVCSPAGVWTVTTVTRSWAQEATVAPACAPMGRAVDATFPTAVTLWLTSWCVCAALATKVYNHTHTHTPKTLSLHPGFVSRRRHILLLMSL